MSKYPFNWTQNPAIEVQFHVQINNSLYKHERRTVINTVAAALSMTITDADKAREIAIDVLIALRRSGFVVVAPETTARHRR